MESTVRARPVLATGTLRAEPIQAQAHATRYATLLLLFACSHHWLLCVLQNVGIHANSAMVGGVEFLIYLACLPLVCHRISTRVIAALLGVFGLLTLMGIARGGFIDIKAMRDLLIPAMFIWAGRSWRGSSEELDRALRTIVTVVVAIGLLEAVFFDLYTRYINTFTYYIGLGGIAEASAQIAGQTVTLNGLRPEGIGRTLLPQLLGPHRVSSVFLEPVSLGNFAVIVLAWGLAKPAAQWRNALWFVVMATLLVVLADSRFAFYSAALLFALRLCVRGNWHYGAVLMPIIGIVLILVVRLYLPGGGDNLHGRLTTSGARLLEFDVPMLLGLGGTSEVFGDMGYAYVISRFGVPLAGVLWLLLFVLPMPAERARRFRTSMAIYVSLILCVSGTSVFALKTAGLLWFLFGHLSMQPAEPPLPRHRAKISND